MAINFAPQASLNPLALSMAMRHRASDGTSSDIEQKLQEAYFAKLLNGATDTGPVQHPMQAVARAFNGYVAGQMLDKLTAADKADRTLLKDTALSVYDGLQPQSQAAPPQTAPNVLPQNQSSQNTAGVEPWSTTLAKQLSPEMFRTLTNPKPMADQPAPLSGGNPGQGIDRSRIGQELEQNPAAVNRYANMISGETGYRDPRLALIQAETVANRALARGIPLEQALLSVGDDPKRGYYARDTYSRPASPQQRAQFQNEILPKVIAGSDESTDALGFRATGNASQLGFAQRRADQGMYDDYKWYSGQPGRGEMYAVEKGDQARMAKNLRPNFPRELMSPQTDVTQAAQFAPVQVASEDPSIGIPRAQPGIGSFAPDSLPNVQNMRVRPTGYGGGAMQQQGVPVGQQQPQMAQPQMPSPMAISREQLGKLLDSKHGATIAKSIIDHGLNQQSKYFEVGGKVIAIDPRTNRTVTVFDSAGDMNQPGSAIPPVPQGVDPAVWRKAHSENAATNALPMDGKNAAELRKEVLGLPSYKNYSQAFPIYRSMRETAGRNSRASDLNLVYGLGKIMDPTSVVREGEMVMVKNTSSLPDWLAGAINQVNGGAMLQPATRDALMQEAHSRMKSYEDAYEFDTEHYRGIVKRGRGNSDDVIPPIRRAEPWRPEAATPLPQSRPITLDSVDEELRRRGLR